MWDSHCHLADPGWGPRLDHQLHQARSAGIRGWLSCAYDQASWSRQRQLQDLPGVKIALGIHPWAADAWQPEVEFELRRELQSGGVVALGECGLDYYRARQPEARLHQRRVLQAQLQLAREADLPVVLHSVRCHQDLLAECDVVPGLRCMVHGFLGTLAEARDWLNRGCFLSLGPHARSRSDLMKFLPRDQILLETDAPSRGASLLDLVAVSQAYRAHHPQGNDCIGLNLHRFLGSRHGQPA